MAIAAIAWIVHPPEAPAQSTPHTYAPSRARSVTSTHPWRRNITASVFWIGEKATAANPRHNRASSWDTQWMRSYGGFDDPDRANRTADYCPKGFTPKLNPFYIALPYNDRINWEKTKSSARRVIPWFKHAFERPGKSVCHGRWVAIHHAGRTCFAQWSDVGPFETDDWSYVFGSSRPKNTSNKAAGIDLSPAVRDYLKIKGGLASVDWRFVELREIPYGPWRKYGTNNHFIHKARHLDRAKREEIQRLKAARDQWLKSGGH